MQQFQENYYIQNFMAKEHMDKLHKEAEQYRLANSVQKTSLRKRLALRLVKIAERLEPTLKLPPYQEVITEEVTTSFSK